MPEWSVPGYTAVRVLGSGGFGEVILARHDATGTPVAIKYLRPDLLADPGFAEMFRAEADVLVSLEDPNIVRLYEYVEGPAGAAIVMELVDGVSLRQILTRRGRTSAEAALVVLHGSLLGLAAAHQRGVVHRDYKPENVLVSGDGTSKLTDFGIAARAGDRPLPAGSYLYVAPEQVDGGPASPASDVYAATATFYECLTGQPPFTGESAEVLHKHRFEPVPLDPVPEPLRPLVAAGMAKDPGRRPADASIFVAELEMVASGAYGTGWRDRGRSHLGEAALLLAALWPAGALAAAAVPVTALQRIPLLRALTRVKAFRHLTPVKAAVIAAPVKAAVIAGAAVVATGAAVTIAATVAHSTAPSGGQDNLPAPSTSSPSPSPGGGNGPATGSSGPNGGPFGGSSPSGSQPYSSQPYSSQPYSSPPYSSPPYSSPPYSSPPYSSSPYPSGSSSPAPFGYGSSSPAAAAFGQNSYGGRWTTERTRVIRLTTAMAPGAAMTAS
jgi:serine/threonine-protein kinase